MEPSAIWSLIESGGVPALLTLALVAVVRQWKQDRDEARAQQKADVDRYIGLLGDYRALAEATRSNSDRVIAMLDRLLGRYHE